MSSSQTKTLVVVCPPKPTSLTRTAAAKVVAGLAKRGDSVEVIDLDELDFNPILSLAEQADHLGDPADRPDDIAEHVAALRRCQRLVLVYPTWFSDQPARLKGWFDRVWINDVAFVLPDGSSRIRGKLSNIRRIDVVTSHGASRLVNFAQGNAGRLRVRRTLRALCHWRCRTTWNTIYAVDRQTPEALTHWLEHLEQTFST